MGKVLEGNFGAKKPVDQPAPARKEWTVETAAYFMQQLQDDTPVAMKGAQLYGLLNAVIQRQAGLEWIEAAVPRLRECLDMLNSAADNAPEAAQAPLRSRAAVIVALLDGWGTL